MKLSGLTGLTLAFGLMATAALAETTASRIISLGGSVTEIIVALGAEEKLIARDTTSTWPESILALPDVGYVRAISPEGVLALDPDLILAEGGAGPAEAVDVLKSAGIPYVAMPDDPSVEGIAAKIRAVAAALDLADKGEALATQVTADLDKVAALSAGIEAPKKVLFVLSMDGGKILAGGEGSSAEAIIKLAGGVNAAAGFQGYKQMTDEAVIEAAPDVLLMMSRDGDHKVDMDGIKANPALSQTPAAASEAVIRMDGMLLLGFGPRTPEAALSLHDALYPGDGG